MNKNTNHPRKPTIQAAQKHLQTTPKRIQKRASFRTQKRSTNVIGICSCQILPNRRESYHPNSQSHTMMTQQ